VQKTIYLIAITIGSGIGSYLPTLFGAGIFSLWSIVGGFVGAILALYLAYKYIIV
jgi:hypothetical protein